MFVYRSMSGLSISFRVIKISVKEILISFIYVLPSGSKSILKKNLQQPYFPKVAFSQIRGQAKENSACVNLK